LSAKGSRGDGGGVTGALRVRLTKSLRPTARRFFLGLIPRGLAEGLCGEEATVMIYHRLKYMYT
jgi:hypothetical protein